MNASLTTYETQTIARALRVMERVLRTPGEVLTSPTMVRQYLMLRMAALPYEVFMVLLLDSQNRLIEARELFRGTLSQTAVYPREVVKSALVANAAAVILAHNHPCGMRSGERGRPDADRCAQAGAGAGGRRCPGSSDRRRQGVGIVRRTRLAVIASLGVAGSGDAFYLSV